MNKTYRVFVGTITFLTLYLPGAGLCGAKIQTEHLVVDDVQQQLSASELEQFAAVAEKAFVQAVDFWSVPVKGGRIILELQKEYKDHAFSVFQMESTKEGKRSLVRVYGVKNPQEMVHKLTHALFPTEDKLIRNMMGIPTELRFGNPRSFPMCGYSPDTWVTAIRRTGSYIPIDKLGESHEDWGMSFHGKTPVVSDRKRQHASYAEAGSFGNFLLNRFGVGKIKAFVRASREEIRPWKKVFGLDIRELEAEWLKLLDTAGKTPEDQVKFLAGLWKQNPKTACTRAEEAAVKKY
jgi:hypothetical protein